jgi:hypothetical protein
MDVSIDYWKNTPHEFKTGYSNPKMWILVGY